MFDFIITGYRWIFLQMASVLGPGWAIVALSFICSALMAPLMKAVAGIVRRETEYQSVINPQLDAIKVRYPSDIERHLHIQRLYSRYSYSPLSAVKKVLPLFVQIPFLLLTYYMLKGTAQLAGVQFLFLKDLGTPDALFAGVNFLPFIMTGVNIMTVFATPSFTSRDQVQAFGIAILFLAMLYTAPSALLLYWTLNNAITMVRTLVAKKGEGAQSLVHATKHALRWVRESKVPMLILVLLSLYSFQVACAMRGVEDSYINQKIAGRMMLVCITGALFYTLPKRVGFVGLTYSLAWFAYTFAFRNSYFNLNWVPDWHQTYLILYVLWSVAFAFSSRESACCFLQQFACAMKKDWPVLLLPVLVALHYSFSSDGFNLSAGSIVCLAIFLAVPCLFVLGILAFVLRDHFDLLLILRVVVSLCVGAYLVPMIARETGPLAYQGNFLIRVVFVTGVIAVVLLLERFKLMKVFVSLLILVVGWEVFQHRDVQAEGAADAKNRTCHAPWMETVGNVRRPNIYLLAYDGYAHRTVLEKTGIKDFDIEKYLAGKGFNIYDAYSIGCGTIESMSSTFVIGGVAGASDRSTLAGDNVFVDYLKKYGYKTSFVLCGYELPSHGERMPGDYYYPTPQKVAKPENALFVCIHQGFLSQSARTFDGGTPEEWNAAKNSILDSFGKDGSFAYVHTGLPGHNAWSPRYRKSDAEEIARYKRRLDEANKTIMTDVEGLITSGQLENSIVIVASDHGGFLLTPKVFGLPTPLEVLDREGILMAVHWPKDYHPTLRLNCLQNLMLEVLIYLSGDANLARFEMDGTTHAMIRPLDTPVGFIKGGVIQMGKYKGETIFEAANR